MSSTITIAGTSYPAFGAGSRPLHRFRLDRLMRSLDGAGSLDFHEFAGTLPMTFHPGQAVTLSIGSLPVFTGEISRRQAAPTGEGWRFAYTCQDAFAVASRTVPVTNPNDFTGTITFNLPTTEFAYIAALAGKSVGDIVDYLLSHHATALAAAGIAGYLTADLTGLTLVPPEPVTIQGPSLIGAIRNFLDEWAGNVAMWVDWQTGTSDWRLRFQDPATFTAHTLTLGTDPIEWPSITEDASGCYTSVVARGRSNIQAWSGLLSTGAIAKDWTTTGGGNQESLWTIADFTHPKGYYDSGTVNTATLGSTSATITSAGPTTTWASNFWPGIEGTITLINPLGTGLADVETKRVTANTSLSAGGTSTLTLDSPLANGGYSNYQIVGSPVGGEPDVWRRFTITNTWVAQHLVATFPQPVGFANAGAILKTQTPAAMVFAGGAGFPRPIEVDPTTGSIRFMQPVVMNDGVNTSSTLTAGGASVIPPTDILVFLPYSRGVLTATYPSSGFAGTAFTQFAIQRTLYIDVPSWILQGDQTTFNAYAQMKHATVSNTVVTGSVTYLGLYTTALTLGMSLNIAGATFTTGWESLAAPVRSITVEWPEDGPVGPITTLALNNLRKQATGDTYYIHPAFTGGSAIEGGQSPLGSAEDQQLAHAAGAYGLGSSLGDSDWQSAALGTIEAMRPSAPDPGAYTAANEVPVDLASAVAPPMSGVPVMSAAQAFGSSAVPVSSAPPASGVPVSRMGPDGNEAPSPAAPAAGPGLSDEDWVDKHAGDIWGGGSGEQ